MIIEIRPTSSDVCPPTIARENSSRPTSSVPNGYFHEGAASVSAALVTCAALGALCPVRVGPRKHKRNRKIRKQAPTIAALLRLKRTKMIRRWLQRFCTKVGVSSTNDSPSSHV